MKDDFLQWFNDSYKDYLQSYEDDDIKQAYFKEDYRFIFLSSYIFNVITYDDELDLEFGKKIYEVMKSIQGRTTFEYITEPDNYRNYILVCNLLNRFELIDWGMSIRGAWFSKNEIETVAGCWGKDGTAIYENPVISIKELIKWLEIEKLEEK